MHLNQSGFYLSFQEYMSASQEDVLHTLTRHIPDAHANAAQMEAWRAQLKALIRALRRWLELQPDAQQDYIFFEYELPRQGGRRPDILLLCGDQLVVVEFKNKPSVTRADVDQAAAYARDLRAYHSECEQLHVTATLMFFKAHDECEVVSGVKLISPDGLVQHLMSLQINRAVSMSAERFMSGVYQPTPTLIEAARLLFHHEALPSVRQARSAEIPVTIELTLGEIKRSLQEESKRLILITGAPGAGKTLVGLQVVYQASGLKKPIPAALFSGNAPLVKVLSDALRNRAFVQDVHRFVRDSLQFSSPPHERLIVFDEAQRAWDAKQIHQRHGVAESEPKLIMSAAQRHKGGACVLALIGEGQEIHKGEEGGMKQWAEAARQLGWEVLGPPSLEPLFSAEGVIYQTNAHLHLSMGLRYHAAQNLYRWVDVLLRGELQEAKALSAELNLSAFALYVTDRLESAKEYIFSRSDMTHEQRGGLLASSKAQLQDYGVDASFKATSQVQVARWFNDHPHSTLSGCQLKQPITEFQAQGLELDLAILCWGHDLTWRGAQWRSSGRTQPYIHDPHQLTLNAYRVLLTRAREGLVIWVPPTMTSTFQALQDAGIKLL